MPIYEYRCRACGDTSEQLRSLASADDAIDCACGVGDVVRLPSLVARRGAVGGELPMAGGAVASAGGGCCGGGCCG